MEDTEKELPTYQKLLIAGVFALVIFLPTFLISKKVNEKKDIPLTPYTNPILQSEIFNSLELEAKSIAIYDPRGDTILYTRGDETPQPLASLTKLMVAYVVIRDIPQNEMLTLTEEDISLYGDVGLEAGSTISREDLIRALLVSSSNDAAAALARMYTLYLPETSLLTEMNSTAQKLGLTSLTFKNVTGLDYYGEPSAFGTASDVSKLHAIVFNEYNSFLSSTSYQHEILSNQLDVTNTNPDLNGKAVILSSKTGYTDKTGGNVSIITEYGYLRPLVITILGSSFDGRFVDAEKILLTLRTMTIPKKTSTE